MIRLKTTEITKVWVSYTLELTDVYVRDFNDYLQTNYKRVNGEKMPYIDAESIVQIYQVGFVEKLKDEDMRVIPVEFEEERIKDGKTVYFNLIDIMEDIVDQDVWNGLAKEENWEYLGCDKSVEEN